MPFAVETPLPPHILKRVALLAFAVMACAGLAGCGGGSGGGGQVMIMPDPQPPPQESPNVEVESLSVGGAGPIAGAGFSLSATVRNAGEGSAPTVRFYRSADMAITASDEEVATAVARPAASGRIVASVELTAPSDPGVYYYGACVGAAPGESEAANDCSPSLRITVQASRAQAAAPQTSPPRPDLVVESNRVDPASPASGGILVVYVDLRNAGGRDVENMMLRFYRSADATITPSDTQVLPALPAYLPARKGYRSVPSGAMDTPAHGVWYYGACADAVDGESDTTNNCSAGMKVEVTHNKPNLQVHMGISGGWRENDYPLFAGVRNLGGPAPATTLRFYHSTDKTITPSDTQVGEFPVPALVKTKPHTVPRFTSRVVQVTPPPTGTHHYGACVDVVAGEYDTTDNCRFLYTVWR